VTYQNECISGDECVADYDPREGLLMANTGSKDAIAGTTTTVLALDKQTSHLAFLNCGDSRGLLVNSKGKVLYKTRDHTPEREAERLTAGKEQGLLYKEPQCRMNRWAVEVGDYDYAVARSLEGPFATARGIVATADTDALQAEPGTTAVIASDGLYEIMDSDQVARLVTKMRWEQGMSAGGAAKSLCYMAVEKGSSDNVSVVVVYIAD
jgi:serine/threonine protein phosphatase PrpC